MKYLAHVPVEQYGFISVEVEGTPEAAVEAYRAIGEAVRPQPVNALPTKEFNAWLDRYLKEKTGDADSYERMSPAQKDVIQAIKRSYKRTN